MQITVPRHLWSSPVGRYSPVSLVCTVSKAPYHSSYLLRTYNILPSVWLLTFGSICLICPLCHTGFLFVPIIHHSKLYCKFHVVLQKQSFLCNVPKCVKIGLFSPFFLISPCFASYKVVLFHIQPLTTTFSYFCRICRI